MRQIWKSFRALYFASLMMLIGSGLLSTYLALRLAADHCLLYTSDAADE